jgi:hypothetical protein
VNSWKRSPPKSALLQLATAHEGGEKTSVSNRKSFDEFSALRSHTEHWQVTWLIVGNPEIIR